MKRNRFLFFFLFLFHFATVNKNSSRLLISVHSLAVILLPSSFSSSPSIVVNAILRLSKFLLLFFLLFQLRSILPDNKWPPPLLLLLLSTHSERDKLNATAANSTIMYGWCRLRTLHRRDEIRDQTTVTVVGAYNDYITVTSCSNKRKEGERKRERRSPNRGLYRLYKDWIGWLRRTTSFICFYHQPV